jgi:hypothetical protein
MIKLCDSLHGRLVLAEIARLQSEAADGQRSFATALRMASQHFDAEINEPDDCLAAVTP